MHLLDVLEWAFININIFFLLQVKSQYATVNIKSMFIKSVIFIVKTLGLLKLKMWTEERSVLSVSAYVVVKVN